MYFKYENHFVLQFHIVSLSHFFFYAYSLATMSKCCLLYTVEHLRWMGEILLNYGCCFIFRDTFV